MKVEPAVYRFPDNKWGWCKLGEVAEIVNAHRSLKGMPTLTAREVFEAYQHLARPGEGSDIKLSFPPYLYVFSEKKTQVVLTGHFNSSCNFVHVWDSDELLLPRGWAKDAIKVAVGAKK